MSQRRKWRQGKWKPLKNSKGVGRPITDRDFAMLQQFQSDNVGRCYSCRGRNVAPLEPGTATYRCADCGKRQRMRSDDCQFYPWKPELDDRDD